MNLKLKPGDTVYAVCTKREAGEFTGVTCVKGTFVEVLIGQTFYRMQLNQQQLHVRGCFVGRTPEQAARKYLKYVERLLRPWPDFSRGAVEAAVEYAVLHPEDRFLYGGSLVIR